jgi:hypothetical protein
MGLERPRGVLDDARFSRCEWRLGMAAPGADEAAPVVRVSGKGSGRVSAGLACLKAGSPARFFVRLRQHRGRKG